MEREKIQATGKLRQEMLYKIKETKANLLTLNDEQLQTTTRLTILQNHQLTTELEHQSKQTEELLYKNNKMRGQIDKLKRDINIHKEVEKELAKRSHFCQKVIQRLKGQTEDLEEQKKKYTHGDPNNEKKERVNSATYKEAQNDEELINFLEQKLETIEKQLKATQQQYESLQVDYASLQEKLNQGREKYKRAALLMTEFLHDILTDRDNVLTDLGSAGTAMKVYLDHVRETPLDQLDNDDKRRLVFILLKQL